MYERYHNIDFDSINIVHSDSSDMGRYILYGGYGNGDYSGMRRIIVSSEGFRVNSGSSDRRDQAESSGR